MIHRNNLGYLLNSYNLTNEGLELGVLEGEYSKEILKNWKGRKLHLVDCWQTQKYYDDKNNLTDKEHNKNYKKTIENTKEYEEKVSILKMFGCEASMLFSEKFLDFIYIDANHSYFNVLQDLNLWYPKLKENGIICGHDFFDGTLKCVSTGEYLGNFGVKKAVCEFAQKNNLNVSVGPCSSWYILPKKHSKIGFLNTYNENYASLDEKTCQNKIDYCNRHAYTYYNICQEATHNKHVAFNKFSQVLKNINNHDWIFYNDIDTLIMNHQFKIESIIDFKHDIVISYDINGINTGNFLARNTEFTKKFLTKVYNRNEFNSFGGWADQIAFCNTYLYSGEAIEKIKLVPQKLFNSYLYETFGNNEFGESPNWSQGQFSFGDFMLHLCGQDAEQREANIKKYLPQVII